jgi:hypothetical protein
MKITLASLVVAATLAGCAVEPLYNPEQGTIVGNPYYYGYHSAPRYYYDRPYAYDRYYYYDPSTGRYYRWRG